MYSVLDIRKTTEFYLVKQGWFSNEYELTDHVYAYGKIIYHRFTRRKATVITATDTWVIEKEKPLSRTILITDRDNKEIGKATSGWFDRKTMLIMSNGFQVEFYRDSILSHDYSWVSQTFGKIMHIHSRPLRLASPIYIDQTLRRRNLYHY
jgi:hypothetical protein